MRRRLILVVSIFLCSICLYGRELERLEAFLVFDTKSDLRSCLEKNKQLMVDTLVQLAKAADMRLKVQILERDTVTSDNIQKWLMEMQHGSHDVILFYFSGHGRNNGFSEWPLLYLYPEQKMVEFETIIGELKKSQAKLTLLFSDCCNMSSYRSLSDIIPLIPTWNRKTSPYFQQSRSLLRKVSQANSRKSLFGARSLLTKKRGLIAVTAASKRQLAIAFYDVGTVFTVALTSALINRSGQRHTSWPQVLDSIEEHCQPLQLPHKISTVR